MPGEAGLVKVGVEALVMGLQKFVSDIGTMKKAVDGLKPQTNLIGGAFEALSGAMGGFAESIGRIAEHTIGFLLRDAINAAVDMLKELVDQTIMAGDEFQKLQIRLDGMNMNDLIKSGTDANNILAETNKLTAEQIDWLSKISILTPYDSTDIANVFAMARAYGFNSSQSQVLTTSIADFASAMGLGNTEIERIIVNFGQMVQRGKITAREMNDLARGALVPIGDVLERIGKKLGMTVEEVSAAISKPGGGVAAQEFIDAFLQMVKEEPRFVGAAERMSATFKMAVNNSMDLARNVLGLNVVAPIMDVLGGKIAGFTSQFVTMTDAGAQWTDIGSRFQKAAERIGTSVANILTQVMGGTDADNLAGRFVEGFESIANWLDENSASIISQAQTFIDGVFGFFDYLQGNAFINNTLLQITTALQDMFDVITDPVNVMAFQIVFGELSDAINEIWMDITGIDVGNGVQGIFDIILNLVADLADFLKANKNTIVKGIQAIIDGFNWFIEHPELTALLIGMVLSITLIAEVFATAATAAISFGTGLKFILGQAGLVALISMLITYAWTFSIEFAKVIVSIKNKIKEVIDSIKTGGWAAVGRLAGELFTTGIIDVIRAVAGTIANILWTAISTAITGAISATPLPSYSGFQPAPSYTPFTTPAYSNYNQTNNYNLNINSSASTEPIIQDYNMMKTIGGGKKY